ncbi:MAG: VWA domain-containing protein [Planctomycetes bacterium]|nr:VWA domain-containing protein [Planctomycetota bacterium]
MNVTWFANSFFLVTLAAIPLAWALMLFAWVRRRQMAARLAAPLSLRNGLLVRSRMRIGTAFCLLLGLTCLALAIAGPQWGLDKSGQIRKGRDVILLLDLSRSMSAEQPSRRELALRSLRHLANAFEETGGNRVALIVFAAEARLLIPLTRDCEHLRQALDQIEADDIAALSAADAPSGTRIGTALKLAAQMCAPGRTRHPVLVLLSDGDDPAEDKEWLEGVSACKEKALHVHVVGFGNPAKDELIPLGRDFLQYQGRFVRTRLREDRLRDIADQTGGIYLAAHASEIPLGAFVLHLLDADSLREETAATDTLPVYQLRYAWFLLPAFFLFALTLIMSDGIRITERKAQPIRTKAVPVVLVLLAMLGVSAADGPEAEMLVRQGTQAFAETDFEEAVKLFEKAETLTLDPGRVAFNKAAALYRLGRFREAIDSYRRCLEDDRIPAERRARARFDLGNALVQYAKEQDAGLLAEAVATYRACLLESNLPAALRQDARHNLEIAQLQWLKARQNETEEKDGPKSRPPDYPKDDGTDPKKNGDSKYVPVDPKNDQHADKPAMRKPGDKSRNLQSGVLTTLPDSETVRPLSLDETLTRLEILARRIAAERRAHRNLARPAQLTTKDW